MVPTAPKLKAATADMYGNACNSKLLEQKLVAAKGGIFADKIQTNIILHH
jgi:hypothetical protein